MRATSPFEIKIFRYRYKNPPHVRPDHPTLPPPPTSINLTAHYVESPQDYRNLTIARMAVRERGGDCDNHVMWVSPLDLEPIEPFEGRANCHGIITSPTWLNNRGDRFWLRSDLPLLKGRRTCPILNLAQLRSEEVHIRDVRWLPDRMPGPLGPYISPLGPKPGHWITLCRGYGGPEGLGPGGGVGASGDAELIPFPGMGGLKECQRDRRGKVGDMPVAQAEEPEQASPLDVMKRKTGGPLTLAGPQYTWQGEKFRVVISLIEGEALDGMLDWITNEELDTCYVNVQV
ncbi:hypothetical protein QBC47DRAFT_143924 [Echria macrotheca]|uniref:Uncharacterized protein n=1 Tax=Echria macrotheca TaxID=438768 RepID=A0AAJ0FE99_9PEZI|nr:hypothetical protein QBC47DRAFT_143924 [Echria macrotheca]